MISGLALPTSAARSPAGTACRPDRPRKAVKRPGYTGFAPAAPEVTNLFGHFGGVTVDSIGLHLVGSDQLMDFGHFGSEYAVLGVYSGASQEVAKMMYGVNFECMVTSGVTRAALTRNPKETSDGFWELGP
jgi:hypothetical protein